MGVKISALPTATEAEAASGLIPVVTDPNGDGNLITKHITASSIGGGGANVNTSSTPPSNPSNGDLWFDEGNAELYIYNSSINGWIQTNGGGGGGGDTSVAVARAVLHCTRSPSGGAFFNTKPWSLGSRSQGVASVSYPPHSNDFSSSQTSSTTNERNGMRFELDFDHPNAIVMAPTDGIQPFYTSSGIRFFPTYAKIAQTGRFIDIDFALDKTSSSTLESNVQNNYIEWSGIVF